MGGRSACLSLYLRKLSSLSLIGVSYSSEAEGSRSAYLGVVVSGNRMLASKSSASVINYLLTFCSEGGGGTSSATPPLYSAGKLNGRCTKRTELLPDVNCLWWAVRWILCTLSSFSWASAGLNSEWMLEPGLSMTICISDCYLDSTLRPWWDDWNACS